jgi:hypothetical protein
MTGLEHYREAERLLKAAAELPRPVAAHDFAGVIQTAQVHATLALAAATMLAAPPITNGAQGAQRGGWMSVVGEQS